MLMLFTLGSTVIVIMLVVLAKSCGIFISEESHTTDQKTLYIHKIFKLFKCSKTSYQRDV